MVDHLGVSPSYRVLRIALFETSRFDDGRFPVEQWIGVTEAVELDPCADGIPAEVEDSVDRLYLDPPAALHEDLPDELRVVSVAEDDFVAVFDVGILKGDLASA